MILENPTQAQIQALKRRLEQINTEVAIRKNIIKEQQNEISVLVKQGVDIMLCKDTNGNYINTKSTLE